ncbi:MAG: efflux RND transporter periplasmic adaptor subunit [Planctomycetota bacterium]
MVKWLIAVVVVLLLLGGVGVLAIGQLGGPGAIQARFQPTDNATEVIIETVSRGDLLRTVNAPGSVEPSSRVQISAEVSARIVALPFEEGQTVRAGDIVCRLDAEDLQARLDAAQSRLRSQQAQLRGAEAELELSLLEMGRVQELYDTRDIPKTEYDATTARKLQAESSLAVIEAGIEAAQADVRAAQRDLDNAVISSPIDGHIVALPVEVGETVLGTFNNQGSLIMEIADLGTMVMRARVDETSVSLVREGQAAQVRLLAYADRVFDGVVERVGLQRRVYTDGTSYVEAEVLVRQAEGDLLRTGLTANADIQVETVRDAIRVPSQAVLDRRTESLPPAVRGAEEVDRTRTFATVVYVVEDGRVRVRPVRAGVSDLSSTVILSGLSEGERVITGPFRALQDMDDGQQVVEEGSQEAGESDDAANEDEQADELAEGGGDAGSEAG